MILTRSGCEDCSRLIRSHSGSRIRGVILDLPTMAAGGASGSVSREPVALRRSDRAPLYNEKRKRIPSYNEKEYFYRARVLRRARKMAAAGERHGQTMPTVSTEEAAALAVRCYNMEWAAAVAHYNVAQLQERLNRLEAAVDGPPLPLAAHRVKQVDALEAALSVASAASEEAAPPDDSAAQPAILQDMQPAEQDAELTEATTDAQSSLSRKKKPRRRRRAAADAGATAAAAPAADAGALEAEDAAQASIGEDLIVPEPLVAEELQHRGTTGAWAVVQGLQTEKYSQYNGRIVRVGNQRTNGRFETVRPGSNDKLAVRPENLRWLLGSYDGRSAGDDLADEDDGYGELVLLGFDTVKERWACKHLLNREGGSARYRYRWARIEPSEVSLN